MPKGIEYFASRTSSVVNFLIDWRFVLDDYVMNGLFVAGDNMGKLTWTKKQGNTLYWYNDYKDYLQFNMEGYNYFWICLG